MGDRCSGNCCRAFTLFCGNTPEEVDAYLRKQAAEGEKIADMLVPLRPVEVGTTLPSGEVATTAGGYIFTCRHHDPETGDCRAYSSRPRMCSAFPYGNPCPYGKACSWDVGQLGAWPPTFQRWGTYGGEFEKHTHLRVLQPNGTPHQRYALGESAEVGKEIVVAAGDSAAA